MGLENITISLVDYKNLVLCGKAEDLSAFRVRAKSSMEKELNSPNLFVIDTIEQSGMISKEILVELAETGTNFYTYNEEDKSFTVVHNISDYLRSTANDTRDDNIGSLPIM